MRMAVTQRACHVPCANAYAKTNLYMGMRECHVRAMQAKDAGRAHTFLLRSDTAVESLYFCCQLCDCPLHTFHLLQRGPTCKQCAACKCAPASLKAM